MKICPRCGTTTSDDAQGFCLMDGTPLVDQLASEPTVVMSRTEAAITTQQPRKRKTGLWVTLAILGILVIGAFIGLLLYAAFRMGSESASVKINTNGNNAPSTPKPSGTPKATPQTTPPAAAPGLQPSPESTPDEAPSSDEPTPITWNTSAVTFKTDKGMTYSFQCPAGGTPAAVWGSDVYTADSSVCTAAVHAGKITLDKGGTVKIEFTAGRQTYGATTRNGITTNNYGQYPNSFVFK